MKPLRFHEEAEAELTEAARYYESQSPGLGTAFLLAVEESTAKILINPQAFPPVSIEVRRKLLERFPYGVLYVIEPDRIRILAVAHLKRRPGYWRRRRGGDGPVLAHA